jgi:ADP-ribose pyrophosphatase
MVFEPIHSQPVYSGRAFEVRQDELRLPNGRTTVLDIVYHAGSVAILPIDQEGRVWFVRQYRHAAGHSLLELPAGVLEADETPEAGARREIREETGMAAGKLKKIGAFYLAPGYSTELMVVFLASDLQPAPLPGDEDEFLSVEKITLPQVFKMAYAGEILDSKTLALLMLARPFLESQGI